MTTYAKLWEVQEIIINIISLPILQCPLGERAYTASSGESQLQVILYTTQYCYNKINLSYKVCAYHLN